MGKKKGSSAAGGLPESTRREITKVLPSHVLPETTAQLRVLLSRAASSPHRLFGTITRGLCTSWHFSYALLLLFLRLARRQPVVTDDLNMILNSVLLAHPQTLSVSLREALSGLGNVSIPNNELAKGAAHAALKDTIARSIAEVDNRHMFPALSSFICIQLLSDDEVRSFAPRVPAGSSSQQAASAYLAHLEMLAPIDADDKGVNCMSSVVSIPPCPSLGGFRSISAQAADAAPVAASGAAAQSGTIGTAAAPAAFAFPSAGVAPALQQHVVFGAPPSHAPLSAGALIDWVQTHLSGAQLLQAAGAAHPPLQEQQGLQRAKVQRILELLRGWCAAIALLPDPQLAPYTGEGASGTLQSGSGPLRRVPASAQPLRQLRVHSKAGLYKVEASRLVSLAPTPRTYATVLAACVDAQVTQPTHRLLLQLERTARPSVQQWALGCFSQLPVATTPLLLGLPPLHMSSVDTAADGQASTTPTPADDQVDVSLLVFVLQEAFLHKLVAAGVLSAAAVQAALHPPQNTPQAAMLTAARAAALGNQKGSKHGAAVVAPGPGTVLVSGHNHSYTAPQKAHEVPLGRRFMRRRRDGEAPAAAAAGGDSAGPGAASTEGGPSAAKRPRLAPEAAEGGGAASEDSAHMTPALPTAAEAAALELSPKLLHSRRNKVMHAEVHCISRLAVPLPAAETAAYAAAHPLPCSGDPPAPDAAQAAAAAGVVHAPRDSDITAVAGCEVWVVELDSAGVGFEEAVPCTNCNVALIQQGVARVRYTCHAGVHTQAIRSNPEQPADTLQFGVNARCLNWIRHCQGLPPVPTPGQ